jgi:hypothetical protein
MDVHENSCIGIINNSPKNCAIILSAVCFLNFIGFVPIDRVIVSGLASVYNMQYSGLGSEGVWEARGWLSCGCHFRNPQS